MVEYVYNSLPVSSAGLSLFHCCLGYQPPLFPSQESDAIVQSMHVFIWRCLRTWRLVIQALIRTSKRNKTSADRHRAKPLLYDPTRSRRNLLPQSGLDQLATTSTLAGSIRMPSGDKINPRNGTDHVWNTHFSSLVNKQFSRAAVKPLAGEEPGNKSIAQSYGWWGGGDEAQD